MDTWYHKLARDARQVAVNGGPNPDRKEYFEQAMVRMDKAAKFLMTRDIVDMISQPGFGANVQHLIKADLLKLPFDPMVVEFEPPTLGGRWFVCLRHTSVKRMLAADLLYIFPENMGTGLFSHADTLVVVLDDFFEVVNTDDQACGTAVGGALLMALVCHTTKGIAKEVVAPPEKLNRARAKRRKTLIPGYTLMSVGYVHDRNGNRVKWGEAGTKRTLHWRRAHMRRQRYGVGLSQIKEIMIDAMLVNYNPGDEKPEMPKRKVKV